MNDIPTRQMITIQKLEYSLYFHQLVSGLKGVKVTNDDLFNLRHKLKEAGVADLSLFWDDLLRYKIANSDIRLPRCPIGGAHISSAKNNHGESHHFIHVYPETSRRDMVRAFQKIQDMFPTKAKEQPLGNLGEEVYDVIFKGLIENKKAADIYKDLNIESISVVVDRKTIDKIIGIMKKGL